MKVKLTYFISHPIQYISPLLRELSDVFDLEVYYYSDLSIKGGFDVGFAKAIKFDIPLLGGYKSFFLKNYSRSKSLNCRFSDALNFGVINILRKCQSRIVIVNGWSYGSDIMVILFSWLMGKEIWLRAENPLNQELLKTGWKQKWKNRVLKYIIFKITINKFLYIGSENKKFFLYHGVSECDLIYTPYSVDNEKFQEEFIQLKSHKERIKNKIMIPAENKIILFSGKLIEKKRPLDLLQAFELLERNDTTLVFMGDGPLRAELENHVKNNDMKNVIFTGFINQSEISKYYSIASVFVMCSGLGETWGLSINEAMNFELPVLVSNTTGSSFDLVKHGENGFVFNEGDVLMLANKINEVLSDNFDSYKAGSISREIINDFSIKLIVDNMKSAL
jgi:glycosyltransferase involved in cell wall biosynthesis